MNHSSHKSLSPRGIPSSCPWYLQGVYGYVLHSALLNILPASYIMFADQEHFLQVRHTCCCELPLIWFPTNQGRCPSSFCTCPYGFILRLLFVSFFPQLYWWLFRSTQYQNPLSTFLIWIWIWLNGRIFKSVLNGNPRRPHMAKAHQIYSFESWKKV